MRGKWLLFLLQSLFSKAPSHLICNSTAFSIFKMKKTETWRCLGRIETKTNVSGLWLSRLTNTNQYTIWDTCFNLHFYSWHSTPNLWWMTKIFLGGGLCVCGPSHVPVATVADPNVQESHPGRSPQSPGSQAADHLPPRAPKPRLVFPWVKCMNQSLSAVSLCSPPPGSQADSGTN